MENLPFSSTEGNRVSEWGKIHSAYLSYVSQFQGENNDESAEGLNFRSDRITVCKLFLGIINEFASEIGIQFDQRSQLTLDQFEASLADINVYETELESRVAIIEQYLSKVSSSDEDTQPISVVASV